MHCVKNEDNSLFVGPEYKLLDRRTLQVGSNMFSLDLASQELVVKSAEGEKLASAFLENVVFDKTNDGVFFAYTAAMGPLIALGTEIGPDIASFHYKNGHLGLKLLEKPVFVARHRGLDERLLKIVADGNIIAGLECCAVKSKPYQFLHVYIISVDGNRWGLEKCYFSKLESGAKPEDCRLEIILGPLGYQVMVLTPKGTRVFTLPYHTR